MTLVTPRYAVRPGDSEEYLVVVRTDEGHLTWRHYNGGVMVSSGGAYDTISDALTWAAKYTERMGLGESIARRLLSSAALRSGKRG